MLCALIMAGGKGTRFWPLSTEKKPKQFLNLLGEDTMIQMTVKRLLPLISIDKIFVVTGKDYIELVKEQLPKLPEENIIIEPYGRNTAPAICLSAFAINKKYENAAIAVLPSDHLILDVEKFRETLSKADEFIEYNNKAIVTIGMKPDRPETGYGYIKLINRGLENTNNIYKVEKFIEKPCLEKAKEYVNQEDFLWNGGIFLWKAMNIINLTRLHLRNTFDTLVEIAAAEEEKYEDILKEKYSQVDNISVDYGIMEKVDNIYVIPGDFGWDDVGSWSAVERYGYRDKNGNICLGKIKKADCKNNIVAVNSCKKIVTDIEDSYIIENEGTIFIGKKSEVDNLKDFRKQVEA